MTFSQVSRQPAKLTYHLARNYAEQNKETRRRGKQNVNKPQPVQKNTPERNNTVKSNESGSNAAKTPVITRTINQRDQLPTVEVKQTNNQQPAQQNEVPRSDGVTGETNQKRSRNQRRKHKRHAKFVAEKIASKRK